MTKFNQPQKTNDYNLQLFLEIAAEYHSTYQNQIKEDESKKEEEYELQSESLPDLAKSFLDKTLNSQELAKQILTATEIENLHPLFLITPNKQHLIHFTINGDRIVLLGVESNSKMLLPGSYKKIEEERLSYNPINFATTLTTEEIENFKELNKEIYEREKETVDRNQIAAGRANVMSFISLEPLQIDSLIEQFSFLFQRLGPGHRNECEEILFETLIAIITRHSEKEMREFYSNLLEEFKTIDINVMVTEKLFDPISFVSFLNEKGTETFLKILSKLELNEISEENSERIFSGLDNLSKNLIEKDLQTIGKESYIKLGEALHQIEKTELLETGIEKCLISCVPLEDKEKIFSQSTRGSGIILVGSYFAALTFVLGQNNEITWSLGGKFEELSNYDIKAGTFVTLKMDNPEVWRMIGKCNEAIFLKRKKGGTYNEEEDKNKKEVINKYEEGSKNDDFVDIDLTPPHQPKSTTPSKRKLEPSSENEQPTPSKKPKPTLMDRLKENIQNQFNK